MRMHAIVNGRAGSVLGLDQAALKERLHTALSEDGNDVQVEIVDPVDLNAAIARALSGEPDAVIVGGGDGTIRSAATSVTVTTSSTSERSKLGGTNPAPIP